MKNRLLLLLYSTVLLATFSCDSISDGLVMKAESYPKKIKATHNSVDRSDSVFTAYVKTLGKVGDYSKREELDKYFKEGHEMLRLTDTFYVKNIIPLLDKNESKSEPNLITYMSTMDKSIATAMDKSEYPLRRMKLLKSIDDNISKYVEVVNKNVELGKSNVEDIQKFAVPYFSKYPDRKEDIQKEIDEMKKLQATIVQSSEAVNYQASLKEKGDVYNLTTIADNYKKNVETTNEIKKANKENKSLFKELDVSYSKILKDMKAKFYVQVGRTTWDSYSDWNTDVNYTYPVKEVEEDVFKYFDGLQENVVLAKSYNYGRSVSVNIDDKMWNKLSITPNQGWNTSGNDDGEFWLNNTVVKYYHKYIVESNGKITETGWVEVTEDEFYDNAENLGMSIYSKPLGVFEDEAIEEAAPAGITYVDNPKYGEWKKDESGNSFWAFYGKYALISNLMGSNHHYYRNDYNDYNRNYRNSRPYYGSGNSHTYGTRGSAYRNSSTYKSSNYRSSFANNSKSDFSSNSLRKSYSTSSSSGRSQASSSRTGSSRRGGGSGRGGK